jgi:hypothetical protein
MGIFREVPIPKGGILVLVATVLLLWAGSLSASISKLDVPAHIKGRNAEDLSLARALREPAGCDRVVFSVQGFVDFINAAYLPGYPQIHPVHEYISDALILSFESSEAATRDLIYLWQKTDFQFTPILVSRSSAEVQSMARAVLAALNREEAVPAPELIHGRYVLKIFERSSCETKVARGRSPRYTIRMRGPSACQEHILRKCLLSN